MTLLFYYTLIIMFFYTMVAAASLSAFYVSRRKTFLYATIGFAFYFFDVSIVFMDNFITPALKWEINDTATVSRVNSPPIMVKIHWDMLMSRSCVVHSHSFSSSNLRPFYHTTFS